MSRWKRAERQVAQALGGVRLPNSGRGQPDVVADQFAVQVKVRETLPLWLTEAVDQAERDAAADEVPVLVLSQVSQGRRARRYVVMTFDVWRDMTSGDRSPQPAGGKTGLPE